MTRLANQSLFRYTPAGQILIGRIAYLMEQSQGVRFHFRRIAKHGLAPHNDQTVASQMLEEARAELAAREQAFAQR